MADPRSIADDLLFPTAGAVERGDHDVVAHLDVLADAGLYGLHVPAAHGGLGLPRDQALEAVEALASGCLTSTFVWIQHQGVVKRTVAAGGPLADAFLPRMATGEVRAGVAVGGIRDPDPTLLAHRRGGEWVLDGTVPWISGWGMVDVLLVAAVVAGDAPSPATQDDAGPGGDPAALVGDTAEVVWLLMDAPQPTGPLGGRGVGSPLDRLDTDSVSLGRYDLVALDRTESARATFMAHRVPSSRLLLRQPRRAWRAADAAGLRTNGSLALGLATRCGVLAGSEAVAQAVDAVRARLDRAGPDLLPAARASAMTLAWEAAGRLLVARGGRSVARGQDAERLAREAMVLQVFGTRPAITDARLADADRRLGALTAGPPPEPGPRGRRP